jgi:dTMP kinase
VIIDRYYYSGIVYSAAKNDPTLSLSWCRQPDVGLPRPDLCLFLDISAENAAKRGGYGTEKYEKKEMQDRVRDLFNALIKGGEDGTREEREDIVRIDAGGDVEEVRKLVWDEVQRVRSSLESKGEQGELRVVGEW